MKAITPSFNTVLFWTSAGAGAFFGFFASFFLYLSWVAAPFFGVLLRRFFIPWPITLALALGIFLGGIPTWLSVVSFSDILWWALLQMPMTALLFLAGASGYALFYRFKQRRSGKNRPPRGPGLDSEIKGDYHFSDDDGNLSPSNSELSLATN